MTTDTANSQHWRLLGLDRKAWTLKLIGCGVAAVLAGAAWWLSVHDGLAARPTEVETKALVERELEVHRDAADPHPPRRHELKRIADRQEQLLQDVAALSKDVATQAAVLKAMGKTLDELRADLRRMRRQR